MIIVDNCLIVKTFDEVLIPRGLAVIIVEFPIVPFGLRSESSDERSESCDRKSESCDHRSESCDRRGDPMTPKVNPVAIEVNPATNEVEPITKKVHSVTTAVNHLPSRYWISLSHSQVPPLSSLETKAASTPRQ